MSEKKDEESSFGYYEGLAIGAAVGVLAVVLVLSNESSVNDGQPGRDGPNATQDYPSASAMPGQEASQSYASVAPAPPYHYKTLNEFRGPQPSQNIADLAKDSALQIVVHTSKNAVFQCSASYFNDYVLTAGHCLAGQAQNSIIEVDNDNGKKIGEIAHTSYYSDTKGGIDIGIGTVKVPLNHKSVAYNSLAKDAPTSGEVFVSKQYPAGKAVVGELVYLGGDESQKTLVTDTANGSVINKKLCHPGASGSLELSNDSVAVSDTYSGKNESSTDEYYGLALPKQPETYNCGATVLTADVYDSLVKGLPR